MCSESKSPERSRVLVPHWKGWVHCYPAVARCERRSCPVTEVEAPSREKRLGYRKFGVR
jgi:hypothetical protein